MNAGQTAVRNEFHSVSNMYLDKFIIAHSNGIILDNVPSSSDLAIEILSKQVNPQQYLSRYLIDLNSLEFELSIMRNQDRIRVLSRWNSIKGGAAKSMFTTIPDEKEKIFSKKVFSCMLRQHLGMSHSANVWIKCNACESLMDPKGTHFIDCKNNAVIGRHNDVRDIVSNVCHLASIANRIEEKDLADSNKRPADIYIPDWNHSDAWVDVAVINPSCASHKVSAAKAPKRILDQTAKKKIKLYQDEVRDTQAIFIPCIFDIYGDVNDVGEEFLQRIAKVAGTKNGKNAKTIYREIRSRLVRSILCNTAKQILNSCGL
jgi:hypothetical protein